MLVIWHYVQYPFMPSLFKRLGLGLRLELGLGLKIRIQLLLEMDYGAIVAGKYVVQSPCHAFYSTLQNKCTEKGTKKAHCIHYLYFTYFWPCF